MVQNTYRLRGSSLPELGARAIREYGPSARIIAAEKIRAGGLTGFFGSSYYEAMVEVSDDSGPPPPPVEEPTGSGEIVGPVHVRSPVEAPHDAGEDADFHAMLEDLRKALRPAGSESRAARRRAPAPLSTPGAVVVVTGLGEDAVRGSAALGLETPVRWHAERVEVEVSALRDVRRKLLEARAAGVAEVAPVLAVAPLRFPRPDVRSGADHPVIAQADQLWAAVDVRFKVEDTRRWLTVLAENRAIDGLVILGAEGTLTPQTGYQFGLPVHHGDTGPGDDTSSM